MNSHHEQRAGHLHRIVILSRFLWSMQRKNLAGRARVHVRRRLAADFEVRCRFAPYAVETIVGPVHAWT